MNEILAQLSKICREYPAGEKILVVPTFSTGRHLTDALARAGTNWLNLRIHTIDSLASMIGSTRIAHRNLRLASRAQRLAVVEQACLEVLSADGYFGALRDQPGFHRIMAATLNDLRRARVTPQRLRKGRMSVGAKGGEVASVLERYEKILRQHSFGDRSDLLVEAIEEMREGKRPAIPIVVTAGLTDVRGLDAELLQTFDRVEHLQASASIAAGSVRFVRGFGLDNEIRAILRQCAARALPLDQIEIVLTDPLHDSSVVHEVLSEAGFTATFESGVPITYTRSGRALLGFLEWIRRDWDAVWLRRLVATGVIDLGEGIGYRRAARMIRDAGIGWGRDRYASQMNALVRRADYRAEASGSRAIAERDATRALREVVLEMVGDTPDTGIERRQSTSALARLARRFSSRRLRVASERDAAAKEAILRVLDELSDLPSDDSITLAEACRRLEGVISDIRVGSSSALPGKAHVTSVPSGGWTARKALFIVGATESKFPGSGSQDPILLDEERASLNRSPSGDRVELRGGRPEQREREMKELLSRFEGELVISWSPESVLSETPDRAADFVLETLRALRKNPHASHEDLGREAGEPLGFIPSGSGETAPLSRTEWWMAQWKRTAPGAANWMADDLRTAFGLVASRARADEARQSDAFTEWDGRLDVDPDELDPRKTGEVLSSSRIERLATCPFSYFLRYVLRARPVEEIVRDGTRWLEPREKGLLLHEVFRRLMTEAGGRVSLETDRALAMRIAEAELEEWRRRIPPPNVESWEWEKGEVLRACEVFLEVESREPEAMVPYAFEVAFGGGDPERISSTLESADPVEIETVKGSFRLRGQVDRIDQVGNGRFAVLDYKTGSPLKFDDVSWARGGRQLQHALYARAVDELLRRSGVEGRVVDAGYYFPTSRGLGRKFMREVGTDGSRLGGLLDDLLDVAASGSFIHSDQIDEDCRFCDFRDACSVVSSSAFSKQLELKAEAGDAGIESWKDARGVD